MNIEEERKAFVEWEMSGAFLSPWRGWLAAKAHAQEDIQKLLKICAFENIEQARAYYSEQKPVSVNVVTAQNMYDEGFAAGIAYATEMAKPQARYATIGGVVCLYFGENQGQPGVSNVAFFDSVEAAKVWAANNGYRVVEE